MKIMMILTILLMILMMAEQPDDRKKSKVAVPESITVKLLADGRVVNSMQLTEDMNWTGKFEDLPRYDERDNHEIKYTIEETPVLGYKTEYLHTSVIDVVINKSIIDIPVEKKWVGKKSGPVEVKLYRSHARLQSMTIILTRM